MDLGIYISTFVCLRGGLFVCYDGLLAISNRERRWTDLVWGKVDRFWVSGTDLGVSEGHVQIKGREPKWHG